MLEEVALVRELLRQAAALISRVDDDARRARFEDAHQQAQVPLTEAVYAEVEPLLRLSEQLQELKKRSGDALAAYLRKIELDLLSHAKRIISEVKS